MNLLIVALVLPVLGAAAISLAGRHCRKTARTIALVTSLATAAVVGFIVFAVDPLPEVNYSWLTPDTLGAKIDLTLGLDGLSVWLFGLSGLLVVTSVLVSWEAIRERAAAFYALLLLLETGMLGVFAARDVILFYIFFEFTLIPLFFLIGIWGSEQRHYAAIKFFLFTLAGSLLTFLGLLTIVFWAYSQSNAEVLSFSFADIEAALQANPMEERLQVLVFLALFAGFAIKVPLFPLHTWLPLAHVQAPTAGSVILAGVLLKIGVYGFARFSLPFLPDATVICMPWVLWLSAAGIIYGALVALAQGDIKRLIAYSSVSHLGYCMLGLFSLTRLGVQGGILQLINHGLSTGGLFAIVGMIYERYHTRSIAELGGLTKRTPLLAFLMVLFTFSSIGLPGLNGFVGEFMVLAGMFQRAWAQSPMEYSMQWMWIEVLAVFGVVLGAWYMLWLVQRVFFGPLKEPHSHGHHEEIHDMNLREVCALLPLVVFMFWIGLAPKYFLDRSAPVLNEITARAERAYAAHYEVPSLANRNAAESPGGARVD